MESRCQTTENHIANDPGTVVIVLGRVLDKTKSVDVADVGATVSSEKEKENP